MVVLICAAVHFGSVSRPESGFWEVRAILTRLLQLRRLFLSLIRQRKEGTGQRVAAAAGVGGVGDDGDGVGC